MIFFFFFLRLGAFFIRAHREGGVIVFVLLAVGVVYHAVDVDLFAHVHGEDEREPAGAQVGAGLNPANTNHTS